MEDDAVQLTDLGGYVEAHGPVIRRHRAWHVGDRRADVVGDLAVPAGGRRERRPAGGKAGSNKNKKDKKPWNENV